MTNIRDYFNLPKHEQRKIKNQVVTDETPLGHKKCGVCRGKGWVKSGILYTTLGDKPTETVKLRCDSCNGKGYK